MIVVTAPTGRIGSTLLPLLIEGAESAEHPEAVRVIARDPQKLDAAVRDRAEIVAGSHRDRDVVEPALAGADTLFWLMPADRAAASPYDAYVIASIPAADAVVRHGVQRVVIVSALGRGTQIYGGHVSASLAMEDLFRSTGAHVRPLTMPSFMDNLLRQLPGIAGGVVTGTIPRDQKLPMVATRDIAAAAARFLLDHAWTGQDSVGVMGPEDLSLNDIAATLTDVLDRPVRAELGDRAADKKALLDYGSSEAMAQSMVDMDIAGERGINDALARTPENSSPTTFRAFAETVIKPAIAA